MSSGLETPSLSWLSACHCRKAKIGRWMRPTLCWMTRKYLVWCRVRGSDAFKYECTNVFPMPRLTAAMNSDGAAPLRDFKSTYYERTLNDFRRMHSRIRDSSDVQRHACAGRYQARTRAQHGARCYALRCVQIDSFL